MKVRRYLFGVIILISAVIMLFAPQVNAVTGEYTFVSKFGTTGTGDGQFDQNVRAAVAPDGSIYVVDCTGSRVQRFAIDGSYISQWGTLGNGDSQFDCPAAIVVDADGYVYVSDIQNNRIQKFTAEGSYVLQWGTIGSGDGQFQQPYGIAVAPDGTIVVADTVNGRIQKFTTNGVYLSQWSTGPSFPVALATSSDGSVYIVDLVYSNVKKFTADGTLVLQWGTSGTGDGQLNTPYDIQVAPDNSVFVADTYNTRIQKYDANGVFLTKFGTAGTSDGQFTFNFGIAIGNNSLYVVDYNVTENRIQRFAQELTAPTSLSADPSATEVNLTWVAPTDDAWSVSDYLVEYSSDGGTTWMTVARTASNATMQTVTGLLPTTTYSFRVTAINPATVITPNPSATISATTLAVTVVPFAPDTGVEPSHDSLLPILLPTGILVFIAADHMRRYYRRSL